MQRRFHIDCHVDFRNAHNGAFHRWPAATSCRIGTTTTPFSRQASRPTVAARRCLLEPCFRSQKKRDQFVPAVDIELPVNVIEMGVHRSGASPGLFRNPFFRHDSS
jgi:hypothetical protein